ncbi:MAG: GNAT family N-acetyltransferase [Acidocella sp.]|nr:GNAT family N-acetyltransferase [Acidocella sp.]
MISTLTGVDILPYLPALAGLRIAVFRDYPYLYDGAMGYEKTYLQTYATAPDAAIIIARAGGRVVGAATCLPLRAETANIQHPFRQAGMDISKIFYFGESVLEAPYRGQGIGVAFFAARESQARATGHSITAFCAVQRPADHPNCPQHYQPLDEFWIHRGYTRQESLTCQMSWRDIGAAAESPKTLMFWTRVLP